MIVSGQAKIDNLGVVLVFDEEELNIKTYIMNYLEIKQCKDDFKIFLIYDVVVEDH